MSQVSAEFRVMVDEGADFFVRAQLVDQDGTLLTQSDVEAGSSGIVLSIYAVDSDTPTTLVYTADLNKTAVIFDTPQAWDKDGTGANFVHQVKASDLAGYTTPLTLKGGNRYRVVYTTSTTGGAEIGNVYTKGYVHVAGIF